jgi:hypothetical protein
MPTVPGCDQAIVETAKVRSYLLSNTHPIGRSKARFFMPFGFREDAPEELAQALLEHVRTYDTSDAEVSSYGTKYRVDGPIGTPDGRNPRMSSVWMVRNGEVTPRFITAFPC